jgi:cell division protein FtsQ
MKNKSEIKHFILFFVVLSLIGLFAFNLERSEINDIRKIEIVGNKFLSSEQYLNYSQLNKLDNFPKISMSLIRDRLEKHPYINNIDIHIVERGIIKIKVYEKKMDAVLLSNSKQFMISNMAEIIPWLPSTKNIDLPVIISNSNKEIIEVFSSAVQYKNLFSALKIISTAEIYDQNLYENISEINLRNSGNISLLLSNLQSPIYFGQNNEIEKTVFLSKIFKQIKGNKITEFLDYVDLRFNEMVYLGFDELSTSEKGRI